MKQRTSFSFGVGSALVDLFWGKLGRIIGLCHKFLHHDSFYLGFAIFLISFCFQVFNFFPQNRQDELARRWMLFRNSFRLI